MSVYLTLRITVEPAAFEKAAAADPAVIQRTMALAQSKGLIVFGWGA
jgi:hypothetical protein